MIKKKLPINIFMISQLSLDLPIYHAILSLLYTFLSNHFQVDLDYISEFLRQKYSVFNASKFPELLILLKLLY